VSIGLDDSDPAAKAIKIQKAKLANESFVSLPVAIVIPISRSKRREGSIDPISSSLDEILVRPCVWLHSKSSNARIAPTQAERGNHPRELLDSRGGLVRCHHSGHQLARNLRRVPR
jgi:hypothetical protein